MIRLLTRSLAQGRARRRVAHAADAALACCYARLLADLFVVDGLE